MTAEIEVKQLPLQHYVGIKRRVKPWEMGEALSEILPAVHAYLVEQKLVATSPPVTFYHAHLVEEGVFEIQGGFFVATPAPKHVRFETGIVPAGEVAAMKHLGSYEKLGDTHSAVEAWCKANGKRPAGSCWEAYLTDPGEVMDPGDYVTEVVWPIR